MNTADTTTTGADDALELPPDTLNSLDHFDGYLVELQILQVPEFRDIHADFNVAGVVLDLEADCFLHEIVQELDISEYLENNATLHEYR